MARTTRTALALCLAIGGSPLLAATGRPAQPRSPHVAVTAPASAVRQLWDHLVALWKAEGCIGDPNGARCLAAAGVSTSTPRPSDAGCIGDPNGLCASQY